MNESGMGGPTPDLVAVLERWHHSGAEWQVLTRSSSQVTVALYRCDGVEEDRLVSGDPAVLSFLAGRTSSTQ